jgi:hypothetical protein
MVSSLGGHQTGIDISLFIVIHIASEHSIVAGARSKISNRNSTKGLKKGLSRAVRGGGSKH